jgi:hypothetical protein
MHDIKVPQASDKLPVETKNEFKVLYAEEMMNRLFYFCCCRWRSVSELL